MFLITVILILLNQVNTLSSQLPFPSKSHTPLEIVTFQLTALKNDDMYTVFKYASPSNKAATGPWKRFGDMVRAKPYGILVGHDHAEVLLECKMSTEVYRCIVRVWSSSLGRSGKKPFNTLTGSDASDIENSTLSSNPLPSSSIQNEDTSTMSIPEDWNLCAEFYWILSKCDGREDPLFKDCWMVDGVYPR